MHRARRERGVTPEQIKALVRTIPDFPIPGIDFRDVTTLLGNGPGFAASVAWLAEQAGASGADAIAGLEARGFIFGAAVASALGLGFVPVRKPGKLPVPTIGIDYALEYGRDRLEIDPEAISAGLRVVIVDDLLATGGTASAAVDLLRQAGAAVDHAIFAIELPDLRGRTVLEARGVEVAALMGFAGH